MTMTYGALPFPLSNLPAPHTEVTLGDLRDAALPLLQSAHCTLRALSLAATRDMPSTADLPAALSVLAGHIAVCRDLIDRTTRDR
jgi:hypothetical protein